MSSISAIGTGPLGISGHDSSSAAAADGEALRGLLQSPPHRYGGSSSYGGVSPHPLYTSSYATSSHYGAKIAAAPQPFFKGVVVPGERRRVPVSEEERYGGANTFGRYRSPVPSSSAAEGANIGSAMGFGMRGRGMSRHNSLVGAPSPSSSQGAAFPWMRGRGGGGPGMQGGDREKDAAASASSSASAPLASSSAAEAERRRQQLRELDEDERAPRPLSTEEIAAEVLSVEPALARLLARQVDAFDRARLEYGPAHVLGGDPIAYANALRAPVATVCRKLRQETRTARLVGGWKLRRMALVGKFLYVFRYPGREEGEVGKGGANSSSASPSPTSSPVRSQRGRSSSAPNTNEDSAATANAVPPTLADASATSPAAPAAAPPASSSPSSPSAIDKLLAVPKHSIGAARRARTLRDAGDAAFEQSVLCIDVSRAAVDITARKPYKGEPNVLYIRQHAYPRGGGGGALLSSGGGGWGGRSASVMGGGSFSIRSRAGTAFGSPRSRTASRFGYGGGGDASSARSGDSGSNAGDHYNNPNSSNNSSMYGNNPYASSSSHGGPSSPMGGGGGRRFTTIRPPTVQTAVVEDLTDKAAVAAAIKEGSIVALAFGSAEGMARWVAAIKNRRETVEAIARIAEDAELLAALQRKRRAAEGEGEGEEAPPPAEDGLALALGRGGPEGPASEPGSPLRRASSGGPAASPVALQPRRGSSPRIGPTSPSSERSLSPTDSI